MPRRDCSGNEDVGPAPMSSYENEGIGAGYRTPYYRVARRPPRSSVLQLEALGDIPAQELRQRGHRLVDLILRHTGLHRCLYDA